MILIFGNNANFLETFYKFDQSINRIYRNLANIFYEKV